jgi:hypothetical protein
MNDEAYQPDSLDELPGELRVAVERLKRRSIPEAAMQRALDRAARRGASIRGTDHRLRLQAVLGFAAAVAACIAFVLWLLHPSDVWAQVAKAVQAKTWIHLTSQGANPGQSRECWISTSRGIGGARSEEQVSFFDDRLRIIHRYNPKERVLYRLPASTEYGELAEGQKLLEIFHGLFRGDAELKVGFTGMILKDQKRRQTDRDGRKWDEYELDFQIPSQPDADARMTFVVDAQSHLPHSMTTNNGEWNFDYPDNGPADIYALGVPRDAKLVDRVPTGDTSRILAAIQAGRDRFDDFHAIVIRSRSPDSFGGPGQVIPVTFLVWKKGHRWRVEVGTVPPLSEGRLPQNKEDWKSWVREACQKGFFDPVTVCDGKAVYRGSLGENRGSFELKATATQDGWLFEDAMPAKWCYPINFNAPNDRTEEIVNLTPSEGPPNTILVTSRLVDMRGHDPARTLPFTRFWLDPLRGYAVAREDNLHAVPTVKSPADDGIQSLMDRWEQTPGGIWYPTRVGTGSAKQLMEKQGTWYHFFLDFPSDMPDDLFKPEKRTVLTDEYPVGY